MVSPGTRGSKEQGPGARSKGFSPPPFSPVEGFRRGFEGVFPFCLSILPAVIPGFPGEWDSSLSFTNQGRGLIPECGCGSDDGLMGGGGGAGCMGG